jgi:Cu2+-exporting ATPase
VPAVEHLVQITGKGLEGIVEGQRLRIGRASFVAGLAGPMPGVAAEYNLFLGSEHGWLAAFTVRDELRPGVNPLLARLRTAGLRIHLVSGDRTAAVANVAAELGLSHWQAEAHPADKVAYVQALQVRGCRVAMVGDGFNDMPVMAGAHVSFAFGQAVPLAQARSDVVVLGQQLMAVADTMALAKRSMRGVSHNLIWAAAYNAVCVPLAVMGYLPAWLAGLGMAVSSLVVVLYSLQLAVPAVKARSHYLAVA